MIRLYLLRHAESVANIHKILASRKDFPLSAQGKHDAQDLSARFAQGNRVEIIYCSPLLRAVQTAAPFVTACDAPLKLDERLLEQDLGRFSGMTYAQAESDPAYRTDRTQRWAWSPEGGGESYQTLSFRVREFLFGLLGRPESEVLIVTHAVTLRLFRAVLENTLPAYPETIPGNGELWTSDWEGTPTRVVERSLGTPPKADGE